ncbi:MAG TPA: HYR domain-containing protein [Candidatus Limnocylindrales bacterium]|nr:HYR domain-containing protein [Candidatus Limnocylindrales bacterium]
MHLPDDVAVEATAPDGAVVTYEASATDKAGGSVAVACNLESGSTFQLGTTRVWCSASDANGTATGSFLVTVQDTTPPTVVYGPHPATYAVDETVSIRCTASDAVGVIVSTCADVDAWAWTFGLGPTTLTAEATDGAGNASRASTSFEVVATYPSMTSLTNGWVQKAGTAAQLATYLEAAARAEARGNLKAEAGNLDSYRTLLGAQAGKAISQEDAATLITLSAGL